MVILLGRISPLSMSAGHEMPYLSFVLVSTLLLGVASDKWWRKCVRVASCLCNLPPTLLRKVLVSLISQMLELAKCSLDFWMLVPSSVLTSVHANSTTVG